MKTLLEFITLTKGVEYLIAIAFLFVFIALWLFINHKGKGLAIRIIPVIVMALGLAALTSTCAIQNGAITASPLDNEGPLLSSPVLVEMYGPASYEHELHQNLAADCSVCHHHSEDTYPPCQECHTSPFDPENLNKPGIAHVYHLRCISCHTESQAGSIECSGCHVKSAVPPLSITHPLTGNGNCLSCHKGEIPGVPNMPADHDSATNSVCQLCHQPVFDEAAMATRELPHNITGREDCLMCHGEGIGGALRVPEDHAGRTNETCYVCHKPEEPLAALSPVPAPKPTPVATPAPVPAPAPTPAPDPTPDAISIAIPHELQGKDDCLMCHRSGGLAVPDDHTGRTNETCSECHKPVE